jgi:hypothetical protein
VPQNNSRGILAAYYPETNMMIPIDAYKGEQR